MTLLPTLPNDLNALVGQCLMQERETYDPGNANAVTRVWWVASASTFKVVLHHLADVPDLGLDADATLEVRTDDLACLVRKGRVRLTNAPVS